MSRYQSNEYELGGFDSREQAEIAMAKEERDRGSGWSLWIAYCAPAGEVTP